MFILFVLPVPQELSAVYDRINGRNVMGTRIRNLFLVTLLVSFLGAGNVWADHYNIAIDSAGTVSVYEGGALTFTVELDQQPQSGNEIDVSYTVNDGTATVADNDYTDISGTLTFAGTTQSISFDVQTTTDPDVEADELLTISYSVSDCRDGGGSACTTSMPQTSTDGTILNNDYTVTAFTDISVAENVGTAQLTVQLDRAVVGDPVTFAVSHTPGTATDGGTDYTAPAAVLTITAGSDYGIINVPISDDALIEPDEDFVVSISPTSGNVTAADTDATVLILIEDLYQLTLSPDFSVDVDDGIATVQVIMSPARQAGDTVTLDYTTTDDSAVNPTDYTTTAGTLTFSDGDAANPKTINIPIINDGAQTGSKSFTLDLSNIVGLAEFVDDSCRVTINDHIFTMTAGLDRTVAEDAGNMVFTVTLDRDPIGTEVVEVDYLATDGTAVVNDDYTATAGRLTIDATDPTGDKEITVPIVDDALMEVAEQFTMVLSNASANTLVTDDTAVGTITDDDYEVTAYADVTVNEGVGTAQLTVTLDRVVVGDNVEFAVAYSSGTGDYEATGGGVDYTDPANTLVIAAGASSNTIDIDINDDALVEYEEEFVVTITPTSGNVVAADPDATVTIEIDEQYHFSIDDVTEVEADTIMTFTVTLVTPTPLQTEHNGLQLTVNTQDDTATEPDDYDAIIDGVVTFTDGSNTQPVDVTIKADTLNEGATEQFFVNLTATGPDADLLVFDKDQGVGTIQDTDYIITPTWNLHGSVSLESPVGTPLGISNGSPVVVDNGEQARFTITALYNIQSVTIGGGSPVVTEVITDLKNRTYTFEDTTPKGAYTIDIVFDHEIEMTSTGAGTVTHVATGATVNNAGPIPVLAEHGADESFLLTADSGECVSDLVVDGFSVGTFIAANDNWDGDTYTFANVEDNHTIVAAFDSATITVNMGADDGQSGSDDDLFIQDPAQSGAGWRAYEANASFAKGALIKTGLHGETIVLPTDTACDTQYIVIEFLDVDGWLRPADIEIDLEGNFTDQAVEGLYDKGTYVLTVIADNGGVDRDPVGDTAVGAGRYSYPAGTDVDLTAVADPDWYFQTWQQDASGSDPAYTITMDWDKTVEAVFVQGCQDADGDGYTTGDVGGTGCTPSPDIDCNDGDSEIFPGATEVCGDNIDQDCSGADLPCTGDASDDDGDGYTEDQGDCDDNAPNTHPGLYDDPATAADEDCFDGPKDEGNEIVCSQPSDVPANAARKPAPPMIMFLLDDSGSMDWEFMTSESNQLFSNRYYMHSYDGDARAYSDTSLSESQKRAWPSQFTGYNRIYFDPAVVYSPWAKWHEVAAAASYSGSEQGTVTANERNYDGDNSSFPDIAFVDGFVHADMDNPRLNTVDGADGHSWSHTEDNGTSLRFAMNDTFLTVKSAGEGQQVMVTRDDSAAGGSTSSDAIGLSTAANLELTDGHVWTWYDGGAGRIPPTIIYDDHRADWADIYAESGLWYDSGGDSAYEWQNQTRYTQNSGAFASTRINLTNAEAGTYYVYAWVDDYSDRDGNALYTIFYYDGAGELQSDSVRIDQSPSGATVDGARWIRLDGANSPYSFIEQSGSNEIDIPVAHYFTWDDSDDDGILDWADTDSDGVFDYSSEAATEDVYLVTIPGTGHSVGDYELHYYRFIDANSNNLIEDGELLEVTGAAIPDSIIPKIKDENGDDITDTDQVAYVVRQNFADWFSFYRRRILTAKAAVGLTVYDMKKVELGVHTINRSYHEPLNYIADVDSNEIVTYLATIYDINPVGSTPLRRGLHEVGKYFDETDSGDYANLQTSEGLNEGTCSGDDSVYYDAHKDSDTDTCDDTGGECQKAYVIAMTDGYYNGSFDFDTFGSTGFSDNVDGSSEYLALRDGASNSLADIAMYFYNKDLDSDLDDKIPVKGYDEATYQHMVTYTVSFGVFGRFDPNLFPDCLPLGEPGVDGQPLMSDIGVEDWSWVDGKVTYVDGAGPFSDKCPNWHDSVSTNSPNSIDDLFHSSVNGRGKFLNAANPAELVTAMQTIKQLIDDQQGTASSVAVNARKIQEDTLLFQTTYDSSDWSGDLFAKCLDDTGEVASCQRATCEATCNDSFETCLSLCAVGDDSCANVCVAARDACYSANTCSDFLTCSQQHGVCVANCAGDAACEVICGQTKTDCLIPANGPPEMQWSADVQLAAATVDYSSVPPVDDRAIITALADGTTGVPFTWTGIAAGTGMQTALNDEEYLLQYLRGDHRYEIRNGSTADHKYRNRSSRLGDFINSEPYHYSNTSLGIDWVFAGANDGMLHVFDGQTGEEVFAFIPNAVFGNLANIAGSDYVDNHNFFVDGYITVKDLGDRVVLIGGLGKGGKGYYALDITAAAAHKNDIETYADEIVLWEFSDTTTGLNVLTSTFIEDNLGYSFSRPQLIKPSTSGDPTYYLTFGNGYDSNNHKAVLFLIGLSSYGEIVSGWAIDTGEGDAANCNGLSTPAIIYPQGDGADDFIYAGDLLGNLWKFDVSGDDPGTEWGIYFNDGTNPKPLFSALSNAGYRQPITMQPDVTISCTDRGDGYLVTFGTGRLLDPDVDAIDTSVQSVYAIWDWSKAWEAEGHPHPEQTWLGSFEQSDTSVSAACNTGCSDELGDATTPDSCIFLCQGETECEEQCEVEYASCTTNCSAIRNLSNMGAILGDSLSAKYVSLLRQTQVYVGGINYAADGTISEQVYGATDLDEYDQIMRTMSDNIIEWLEPEDSADFIADTSKTMKHVGWYFDLPANGERVIRDMLIINHKLVYTSSIPTDSPCESGGSSHHWSVNVCNGGRTVNPFFDANDDGMIDEDDYVNIGTDADPIWVAPSSIQVEGLTPSPTVVEVENTLDRFYFPDGKDDEGVSDSFIQGFGIPIQYWREIEWQ